jgi:hypothetical protein
MASQSKFVYQFELDAASAESTAQRLAQIYTQALAQVKIPALGSDPASQAAITQIRAQQAQITQEVRSAAAERQAAERNEASERVAQARNMATQIIEQERRVTLEAQNEARQRQSGGGMFGGLGSALGGVQGLLGASVLGVGVGAAAMQGFQFLSQADQVSTAYRRQSIAARELAGSQEQVNSLLHAYIAASGGAVDKATALAQVTKLETLGFADSAQEVTRFTRGARGASLATGRDADYVISQAQLAIANQSTMRLDQLGIGVGEFQQKLAQLSATTQGLSKDQLYEEAILDIWEQKFGAITNSAEAQATGMERLGVAWKDFKLAVGNSQWFNSATTAVANEVQYAIRPEDQARRERSTEAVGMARAATTRNIGGYYSPDQQKSQLANLQAYEAVQNRLNDMIDKGIPGAQQYANVLDDMAASMRGHLALGDEYVQELDYVAQKLNELSGRTSDASSDTREFAEVTGGVITKQDALAAGYTSLQGALTAFNASQQIVNGTLAETSHWLTVVAGGMSFVNIPGQGLTRTQGPSLPSDEYMKRLGITSSGGFLTPGGNSVQDMFSDYKKEHYQQEKTDTAAANRAAEAAQNKATREWESAAKKTQQEFEAAAKKMSDTFESKLNRIAGLTSPSEVTQEDMDLSKQGLYQPKADEYLRRLKAKANNPTSKEFGDINFGDAARAVGMSGDADPKAIAAAFSQAWSTGALWADRGNVGKFLNLDAVQRDLGQQRQGEIGQRNLLDYLGMDPRISAAAGFQGILPGRMMSATDMSSLVPGAGMMTSAGDAMTGGIAQGAQTGFEKMGSDALNTITQQLTGDKAQAQWNTLGTTIAGMMSSSIESAIGQTDIVGVITAAVLQQINDAQDNQP